MTGKGMVMFETLRLLHSHVMGRKGNVLKYGWLCNLSKKKRTIKYNINGRSDREACSLVSHRFQRQGRLHVHPHSNWQRDQQFGYSRHVVEPFLKAAASACQVNITVLTLLVMTAVNTFKNHSNLNPAYNHNWKSQFIFSTHLGNLFRSIVKKLDLENAPVRLHIWFKEIQRCHL